MSTELQISGLPAASSLALTNQLPTDDNSDTTYKFTLAQLNVFLMGYFPPLLNVLTTATGALNATYSNGTAGVGATLTDAGGTFAAFSNDGVTYSLGETIIVTFQSNPIQNGIYSLTTNGDGSSVSWVLTRSVLFNTSAQMVPGFIVQTYSGNSRAGEINVLLAPQPITIGTDDIEFNSMLNLAIYNSVSADRLLGNPTGSTAEVSDIPLGTGLAFVGGALSVLGGGSSWVNVTSGSQLAVINTGYVADSSSLVSVTLPATAPFGSIVSVAGLGTGGWSLIANTGQTIQLGTASSSSAGSASSTKQYDNVEVLCVVANTTWVVRNLIGNLTVA
jgi:hypothetical protein